MDHVLDSWMGPHHEMPHLVVLAETSKKYYLITKHRKNKSKMDFSCYETSSFASRLLLDTISVQRTWSWSYDFRPEEPCRDVVVENVT